jgi:hypothetical protein
MIETRCLDDLEQIDPVQWESLLARCPDATVFESRTWIRSWWAAFAKPFMRLACIAAYDGRELVGLALLYRNERRVLGLSTPELRFIGEGASDYNVFLAREGAPEVIEATLQALRSQLAAGVALVLTDVPQFSALALCLEASRAAGKARLRTLWKTPCPRLPATPPA